MKNCGAGIYLLSLALKDLKRRFNIKLNSKNAPGKNILKTRAEQSFGRVV